MTALPVVAEIALAAVLAVFFVRSFFGPGPPERDLVTAGMWLCAALLLLAAVLLAPGPALPRELLTAGFVVAACEGGWWLRGRRDDGGDDDGGGGTPRPGGPPIDWDEFDRLRGGWDRPKTAA